MCLPGGYSRRSRLGPWRRLLPRGFLPGSRGHHRTSQADRAPAAASLKQARSSTLPYSFVRTTWKTHAYRGFLVSPSRYYFKKASDEFACGAVFEEVWDDETVLPMYEGRILGKVERIE